VTENNESTRKTWNKFAKPYAELFMELDWYNASYTHFCDLLKQKSSVLELACGPGNITRFLANYRPDLKLLATDSADEMLKQAVHIAPSATLMQLDCTAFPNIENKFDGILAGFLLPYLNQNQWLTLLQDCAKNLNPAGVVYFSAIEGNYSDSRNEWNSEKTDALFVHYYSEAYLLETLAQNGFKPLKTYRVAYEKSSGLCETHLVILARKT